MGAALLHARADVGNGRRELPRDPENLQDAPVDVGWQLDVVEAVLPGGEERDSLAQGPGLEGAAERCGEAFARGVAATPVEGQQVQFRLLTLVIQFWQLTQGFQERVLGGNLAFEEADDTFCVPASHCFVQPLHEVVGLLFLRHHEGSHRRQRRPSLVAWQLPLFFPVVSIFPLVVVVVLSGGIVEPIGKILAATAAALLVFVIVAVGGQISLSPLVTPVILLLDRVRRPRLLRLQDQFRPSFLGLLPLTLHLLVHFTGAQHNCSAPLGLPKWPPRGGGAAPSRHGSGRDGERGAAGGQEAARGCGAKSAGDCFARKHRRGRCRRGRRRGCRQGRRKRGEGCSSQRHPRVRSHKGGRGTACLTAAQGRPCGAHGPTL
mmetsp:Transcript_31668/g.104948  ORF Transcript_31668/g.104948 Transcript_31668/m.104948 type:complete len:377 (+) Transcript_31668:2378-3508(+)